VNNYGPVFIHLKKISMLKKINIITIIWLSCNLFMSCDSTVETSKELNQQLKSQKPGSSFSDTLFIVKNSVVIFQPDSLQLLKIKEANTANVFSSMYHELFYQIRNARRVIKKYYPQIQITETQQHRFLCFINKEKQENIIDLNTIQNMSGIILFSSDSIPQFADMMNIETELSFYFK